VSAVSTAIRDNGDLSFDLSRRGNLVAVVSDSTRVLGDGDCTRPAAWGSWRARPFLMKYLGGVDAMALCVKQTGTLPAVPMTDHKLIEFVRMAGASCGAVTPGRHLSTQRYRVLDELGAGCSIPVWHDDAQGHGLR